MRYQDLDSFTRAYVECALWSSTDDDREPLDSVHTVDDISPQALASMAEYCAGFQKTFGDILEAAYAKPEYIPESGKYSKPAYDESRAGHDFWLTRNRHGAGFWDRGLGEVGDKLTIAAHSYGGESDLYVGDDGLIYC